MSQLFQELKQRRIVQIVASYAVSGWVALEVVGALVERGILPEIVYRVGFVVFLGGLAVAAITGWYHGEKGNQKATRPEIAMVVGVVLATLFFSVQTARSFNAAQLAGSTGTSGSLNLDRVAVLYFQDLSRDGELGYLADGVTESLIDRMGGGGAINPISRSGSEQFRGSTLPRDSIATLLSAGTLVEGSVEPRGDLIRVQVALFDGESGTEINRESFDRPASDLFALQEEVSTQVSELLRVWLGSEITLRRSRRQTESVAAWTDVQRGVRSHREAEEAWGAGDVQGFVERIQRADSLYAAAESADPAWADPTVRRAIIASRWGEASSGEDPAEGREYLDLALSLADQALAKDARSAQALYVRGTVDYLVWVLGLAQSPAEAEERFERARTTLEQATDIDPTLAAAWNTLSILRSQIPDNIGANLAARRALEADEFLRSAEGVLRRLYATSYDIEQFRDAIQYCDQGRTRFPEVPEFTECQLWLMGAPRGLTPDIDEAWRIMEAHLALVPESEREFAEVQDHLVMGAVLARAGMPDSARAVLASASARATPTLDPDRELLGVEALGHLALGDEAAALNRLSVYLTASPEHREGWRWTQHWWWRPLQENADFRRLMGG